MVTSERIRELLANANIKAFLRVIRAGESNQDDSAYTLINGGAHFDDFTKHPWHGIPTTQGARACGAYQFLGTTWAGLAEKYAIPDFSPESQDFGAVADICEHWADAPIVRGDLAGAVNALRKEWVSLPTMSPDRVRGVFKQYGGVEDMVQPAAPIEEKSQPESKMGAALFIPAILQMIPSLISIFGKGGRAETNAKAAQVVVDAFTAAVPGAANAQDAVEKAAADPDVKAAAAHAVLTDPVIEQLMSISPEGIREARTANLALMQATQKWWQILLNPVLLVTVLVLPLVYMFVYAMTFGKADVGLMGKVSADVLSQTMGTVIGLVLGGIMGFWMGQVYQQSNRRANDQNNTPTVGA